VTDDPLGDWAPVYPHLSYEDPATAAQWLERVFGLRQRVRMTGDDGDLIVAKLETPGGGLVVVSRRSGEWLRGRVADFHQPDDPGWPYLTHTVSVLVDDVDAHHAHARAEGALILSDPRDQPWGLRTYAAIDLEGHQWEFGRRLTPVPLEAWTATLVQ
jgi:uncharacterized glyoxalase superfamily protein PhnB